MEDPTTERAARVKIVCPGCQAVYTLAAERIPARGATAKCRRCGGAMVIANDRRRSPQVAALPGMPVTNEGETEAPGQGPAESASNDMNTWLKDLEAFVGPMAAKYLATFKRFEMEEQPRFRLTWHWPAALVGFWWLLYRKLYFWAVVAVVITFIPILNVLGIVGFGLGGNYLYYRHACKQIRALRSALPQANLAITLRHLGGVNRWAMILGFLMGGIGAASLLASLVLPRLA